MPAPDPSASSPEHSHESAAWQLAAETITVRVRWFGLCIGYALVNLIDTGTSNRPAVNAILTLGAVYAILDTIWSLRGRIFLARWPWIVSGMEALFIGLLCYFDRGLESPFRFYYFLSLLVCAMRHSAAITYTTFALQALSLVVLTLNLEEIRRDDVVTLVMMLVFLGWATWAGTALAGLLTEAGRRMAALNTELQRNEALLQERIQERTRALQESQALLVQHEKQAAFGLLAAGIAHEVGNPLAAISSLVQMLNRRQPDEYTREKLALVDDQLRRIQQTLRELVDFSRPASTTRSLCDIHDVVNNALNIAKYYKRTKGKCVVTQYAEGLPRLRVVRDQLVQVVLNLVLNSMDATEEGGTIEITTWLSDGWMRIGIRDDGHGIPDEHRDRIFQPYFTTKATGTGLGLFVCRQIMEQVLHGTIELAESSAAGTRFIVSVTCDMVREHPDVAAPMLAAQEA